eukprot:TRINITY_DN1994_c0_g1_i4.p1 TRINITY_DN1994_c0_g1~~TRINITY_DN1994_c0_g1_i4.p1  ORF type:complete len:1568 (+),score=282.23 TRINITY_DN1994_c0_g1_i4:703-4704(+)
MLRQLATDDFVTGHPQIYESVVWLLCIFDEPCAAEWNTVQRGLDAARAFHTLEEPSALQMSAKNLALLIAQAAPATACVSALPQSRQLLGRLCDLFSRSTAQNPFPDITADAARQLLLALLSPLLVSEGTAPQIQAITGHLMHFIATATSSNSATELSETHRCILRVQAFSRFSGADAEPLRAAFLAWLDQTHYTADYMIALCRFLFHKDEETRMWASRILRDRLLGDDTTKNPIQLLDPLAPLLASGATGVTQIGQVPKAYVPASFRMRDLTNLIRLATTHALSGAAYLGVVGQLTTIVRERMFQLTDEDVAGLTHFASNTLGSGLLDEGSATAHVELLRHLAWADAARVCGCIEPKTVAMLAPLVFSQSLVMRQHACSLLEVLLFTNATLLGVDSATVSVKVSGRANELVLPTWVDAAFSFSCQVSPSAAASAVTDGASAVCAKLLLTDQPLAPANACQHLLRDISGARSHTEATRATRALCAAARAEAAVCAQLVRSADDWARAFSRFFGSLPTCPKDDALLQCVVDLLTTVLARATGGVRDVTNTLAAAPAVTSGVIAIVGRQLLESSSNPTSTRYATAAALTASALQLLCVSGVSASIAQKAPLIEALLDLLSSPHTPGDILELVLTVLSEVSDVSSRVVVGVLGVLSRICAENFDASRNVVRKCLRLVTCTGALEDTLCGGGAAMDSLPDFAVCDILLHDEEPFIKAAAMHLLSVRLAAGCGNVAMAGRLRAIALRALTSPLGECGAVRAAAAQLSFSCAAVSPEEDEAAATALTYLSLLQDNIPFSIFPMAAQTNKQPKVHDDEVCLHTWLLRLLLAQKSAPISVPLVQAFSTAWPALRGFLEAALAQGLSVRARELVLERAMQTLRLEFWVCIEAEAEPLRVLLARDLPAILSFLSHPEAGALVVDGIDAVLAVGSASTRLEIFESSWQVATSLLLSASAANAAAAANSAALARRLFARARVPPLSRARVRRVVEDDVATLARALAAPGTATWQVAGDLCVSVQYAVGCLPTSCRSELLCKNRVAAALVQCLQSLVEGTDPSTPAGRIGPGLRRLVQCLCIVCSGAAVADEALSAGLLVIAAVHSRLLLRVDCEPRAVLSLLLAVLGHSRGVSEAGTLFAAVGSFALSLPSCSEADDDFALASLVLSALCTPPHCITLLRQAGETVTQLASFLEASAAPPRSPQRVLAVLSFFGVASLVPAARSFILKCCPGLLRSLVQLTAKKDEGRKVQTNACSVLANFNTDEPHPLQKDLTVAPALWKCLVHTYTAEVINVELLTYCVSVLCALVCVRQQKDHFVKVVLQWKPHLAALQRTLKKGVVRHSLR